VRTFRCISTGGSEDPHDKFFAGYDPSGLFAWPAGLKTRTTDFVGRVIIAGYDSSNSFACPVDPRFQLSLRDAVTAYMIGKTVFQTLE
jgi:hypothetical protein